MLARRTVLSALVAAAVVAPSGSARAQLQTQLEVRRGAIEGRVHMPNDSTPVVGATVGIVGGYEQMVTNTRGEFYFGNIRPGRYEMRVRRLGMEQLVKIVTVGPGEIVFVNWDMGLLPQMLTEVTVHGSKVRVPPSFQEPFRRAAQGYGDYFLAGDIQRQNPIDTRSLLQQLPGVRVNVRGVRFQRCGTEALDPTIGPTQASEDFGNQGALSNVSTDASNMVDMGIQVYVDGHRMTSLGTSVDDILNSITPSEIEIMEVYRGVARIPVEYLANACAVIAIWTKRG
jgi:hypothetical protein